MRNACKQVFITFIPPPFQHRLQYMTKCALTLFALIASSVKYLHCVMTSQVLVWSSRCMLLFPRLIVYISPAWCAHLRTEHCLLVFTESQQKRARTCNNQLLYFFNFFFLLFHRLCTVHTWIYVHPYPLITGCREKTESIDHFAYYVTKLREI